jgi:hypothetical protein
MNIHLRSIALCLALALCCSSGSRAAEAQQSFHSFAKPQRMVLDTDGQARELVALILEQYGLKLDDEQWEIWLADDADDTPNAAANYSGKRQIYFNKAFMDRIKQRRRDDWTLIAIAAHEVGHHLGNHVLRPWLRRQLAEREADYHAGFVLARMGAGYADTIDVVRWPPEVASSDYPSREQRLCEIGRGWRDGNKLEPIVSHAAGGAAGALLQICEGTAPDPKQFKTRVNRDFYGDDILVGGQVGIPGIELSACAARCQEMPECKAFSFDRWHGWCFPKSKISATLTDPPSIIGVKQPGALPNANQQAQSTI